MGVLAALVVVLTACGNHSDASYSDAQSVAKAAGCTGVKHTPAGETTMYATDEVECRHGGNFVIVDWFKDDASLNNFRTASTGAGYRILYGSDWAISCTDNKADCAAFQKKVGGTLD